MFFQHQVFFNSGAFEIFGLGKYDLCISLQGYREHEEGEHRAEGRSYRVSQITPKSCDTAGHLPN